MLATTNLAGCARVILVSSAGHRYSPSLFDQSLEPEPYDPNVAYGRSKLALIYMANEIQTRYGDHGLHALAVHPGGVKNSIYERLEPHVAKYLMAKFWTRMKSPAQGAATTVWAAVSIAALKLAGSYVEDCGEAYPVTEPFDDLSPGFAIWASNKEASARLWTESEATITRITN